MKVRDLLGAIRSDTIIAVKYRAANMRDFRGVNDSRELDKAFGDREVDNWFTIPGGICINMLPLEEEEDDEKAQRR